MQNTAQVEHTRGSRRNFGKLGVETLSLFKENPGFHLSILEVAIRLLASVAFFFCLKE